MENRTEPKRIERVVGKIKELAEKVKKDLPMFSDADITLRFEAKEEIEAIAEALKVPFHEQGINTGFPYNWCVFKSETITIYIQTHESEEIKNKYEINNN